MKQILLIALSFLAVTSAFASTQQIFKCTTDDGKVENMTLLVYDQNSTTAITKDGQLAILLKKQLNEETYLFTQLNVPNDISSLNQFQASRRNLLREPRKLSQPLNKMERAVIDTLQCVRVDSIQN